MNYILFQSLVVLVGTALLAPALWAQPTEHAVLAARLNQLGNKSPLYTYAARDQAEQRVSTEPQRE